ncbi:MULTISPECIES: putative immunity/bacteriocin fusion bifunctional protein [Bacillus]|uniref:putative immunity/bacteriocin fusion bifunctional protein n=1 Tax=Bacillus TaxID=1386 RepID=UPI0015C3D1BB|nr:MULTISPECIES: putative immunity/bacteriocin fusion bifunctional protein [Bacillus]WFA05561.1 putative immunity/bacteriocin fusion bifunctional protein [Bacillus sp. HSf4]
MKKFMLMFLISVVSIMPIHVVAIENGSNDKGDCTACTNKKDREQIITEIEDVYNVKTEVLSENEVNNVEQIALDRKENFKKYIEEYKDAGYKKVDLKDKSLLFKGAQIDEEGTISDLEFVYGAYKNDKGDSIIYTLGYSKETEEFFNFSLIGIPKDFSGNYDDLDILIQDHNNSFKVFGKNPHDIQQGEFQLKSFSVWGKNFACGMLGFLACSQYCGAVAMVNVGAGAACELICGAAMTAACS